MAKKGNKDYYTMKQMAGILDVSVTTVLRLLRKDEIKSYRIGSLWRVKKIDFNTYLEERGLK